MGPQATVCALSQDGEVQLHAHFGAAESSGPRGLAAECIGHILRGRRKTCACHLISVSMIDFKSTLNTGL